MKKTFLSAFTNYNTLCNEKNKQFFIGLGMMIVCSVLLTPVIQYIRIKSKLVTTVAIFHGTLNAGAGISLMYVDSFNDLLGGISNFSRHQLCFVRNR